MILLRWYDGGVPWALAIFAPPALLIHEIAHGYSGIVTVEENHKAGILLISTFVIVGTLSGLLATGLTVFNLFFVICAYIVFDLLSSSLKFWFCNVSKVHGYSLGIGRMVAVIARALVLLPGLIFQIQTARNLLALAVPLMGKIGTVRILIMHVETIHNLSSLALCIN